MSEPFSRRDFFAFLARPFTRVAQSVHADEQRRRNLQILKHTSAQCARCHAPFVAQGDETLCPLCHDVELKQHEWMQALFKHSEGQV